MRRVLLITSAVSCAAVLVLAAQGASAPRPQPTDHHYPTNAGVTVRRVPLVQERSALAYWTPARRAAAEPRKVTLPASTAQAEAPAPSISAKHHFVDTAYRYPYPFERYQAPGLADYTQFPYSAIGKIFLSDATGDYTCSGAVVESTTESVVLTAGHCATYHGYDIDSAIFIPAYQNGSEPFGEWVVESFLVPKPWSRFNDEAYDVAAYIVAPDPDTGATIQSVTGGLGIAWNLPTKQHWHLIGYPAEPPFSGEVQWTCSASEAATDTVGYLRRDPASVGVGCDMNAGSSGGPWILGFGRTNIVNSIVTYGYPRYRKATFGPYFGNEVRDLFRCAEGRC